ncbi:MAG: IS66 family transposase [Candidatus Woesearchaeota archaeon]
MISDDKDKRIQELEEEIIRLLKEKERINQEKEKINQEKEKIKKEKEKIMKDFEEFKAKHAKTVANLRAAMHIKTDKKKAGKPLGAPKGHEGYARHIPERIDRIKALNPRRCPHCGIRLTGATQEVRSRYVTDLNLFLKAKTTRYDIHRKYCPKCKKIVEPEVPGVLPHARLGLNIMLLVMYLKLGLRLPGNKVRDFLMTMCGVSISGGEIPGILKQLALVFGDYYAHLEKMLRLARVKHTDTTSWRVSGKNYFVWVFVTLGVVIYKIRKRNNHKAGLTVLGRNQHGNVLVVDRHSALLKLAEKAGFILQYCWSHILTDSKSLARDFGAEGTYVHKKLKELYALAKGLKHKARPEQVEQLKSEILQLTTRHYNHSTIRKFVNRLYYKDVENLFRFTTDPDVSSTNNISERELREMVLIRHISKGSRSPRGANTTAILMSIIQTLRIRKENTLQGLFNILNNPSGY